MDRAHLALILTLAGCRSAGSEEPSPERVAPVSGESEPAALAPAGPERFEVRVPGSAARLGFRRVVDPRSGRSFWIGETELPWEAYDSFVFGFDIPRERRAAEWDAETRASRPYGSPDRGWGHDGFPALAMTSHAADAFATWLGEHAEIELRLPTEREWELAAGGGAEPDPALDRTPEEERKIPAELGQAVGWSDSAGPRTRALADLPENELGLRGMLGNVGEWVRDASGRAVLAGGHLLDGPDDLHPGRRELQAPTWNATDPQNPKSRWWLSDAPFVGFRLVADRPPEDPSRP